MNTIKFYNDVYFREGYNPELGVFQAYIPHSQTPKGTGFWGVVNLDKMPQGYNFGSEYTQTHAVNGRLVGSPSFNPFNNDPRYLAAFQNEMLFNNGQLKELSNEDKRTLSQAHRNTYLWASHRAKQGLPPTFVPGIDNVNSQFQQKFGDNEDNTWPTYNGGHAKLYRNGKLIPEEEALSIYQKRIAEMEDLYSQGKGQDADNLRRTLEKQILYGSPSANSTKIWDRGSAENKEKYKDYKSLSLEKAESEFGHGYEDSTKETDHLVEEEQKQQEYKKQIEDDKSSQVKFESSNQEES